MAFTRWRHNPNVILFLHNRYRASGGEERAVRELMWLVREHLHEDAELLEHDSATLGRARAAAGLLGGGLVPHDVARAVRLTGARVLHAHNLHPAFGWRALAAARAAGARVVLHLHQYRLVCAVGVCFTEGAECTRCHGRMTWPGIAHNCRGSRAEAVTYATALALWQRRLATCVDAFVVPSHFALHRLRELGAPVGSARVVPHPIRAFAETPPPGDGRYALVAARLVPEKGIDVAVEACRRAGVPLVVAGEGPHAHALRRQSASTDVTFVGQAGEEELARLRARARIALVPSRFAETYGLAAVEAMAAGLPVAASRIGALTEVVPEPWQTPPGDAPALAETMARILAIPDAGEEAIARARVLAAPAVAARALGGVYDSIC